MAGVFFVERVHEPECDDAGLAAEGPRDDRDLEIARIVLLEVLPRYPEVLAVVQEEVRRRSGPGAGGP